jgi:hypothetical protein
MESQRILVVEIYDIFFNNIIIILFKLATKIRNINKFIIIKIIYLSNL